jgi:hypothetical protein
MALSLLRASRRCMSRRPLVQRLQGFAHAKYVWSFRETVTLLLFTPHTSRRELLSVLRLRVPTFFFFIVAWYPSESLLSALRARAPPAQHLRFPASAFCTCVPCLPACLPSHPSTPLRPAGLQEIEREHIEKRYTLVSLYAHARPRCLRGADCRRRIPHPLHETRAAAAVRQHVQHRREQEQHARGLEQPASPHHARLARRQPPPPRIS